MNLNKLVQKIGYKDYREYLLSTHWKEVRLKLFKSKLVKRNSEGIPVCECCSADKKLHVHHRTYKTIGKERVMDLALVCELCHSYIHLYAKEKRLNLWSATKKAISIRRKELFKKSQSKKEKEIPLKILNKSAKVGFYFGEKVGLVKSVK